MVIKTSETNNTIAYNLFVLMCRDLQAKNPYGSGKYVPTYVNVPRGYVNAEINEELINMARNNGVYLKINEVFDTIKQEEVYEYVLSMEPIRTFDEIDLNKYKRSNRR